MFKAFKPYFQAKRHAMPGKCTTGYLCITGKAKKPEKALNLRDYINSVFFLQVKVKNSGLTRNYQTLVC